MKKNANIRLEKVIANDKCTNVNLMNELIKSDIYYLLINYFEINFEDINLQIDTTESKFNISLNASAVRTKFPHQRLSS